MAVKISTNDAMTQGVSFPPPGLSRPWRGTVGRRLRSIYTTLFRHYGPCHWWPGDSKFEILVGVVLTQNTNWSNVEKAIANLARAGCLDPHKLLDCPPAKLAELIRPSGYYNVKQKRLRAVVGWFVDRFRGSFEAMGREGLASLRAELLGVHGLGPESVDSILLYVLGKPSFVIDAYTRRLLHRHGLCTERASYDDLKALFEDRLPRDAALFNEYHALIVYAGKDYCKPTPRCGGCPLDGTGGQGSGARVEKA